MTIFTATGQRKKKFWVRYINNRIDHKKNFIVLISGPTGSGKSWTGLSLCSMLDENFSPERIIFGFRGLMKLINSGEKYPAGSCFFFDEFQNDGSARTWQSLTNRLLNSLLTTFRHKNFILVITSPYSDFIDSNSRKLLHAEFEVKSIDYVKKQTKIKPQLIQYNSRNKKFYYKYLRVKTERGSIAPVMSWRIDKPPKWIIDEYEDMKTDFTTNLNLSIEKQLDELEKGKSGENVKPLTEKQQKCIDLVEKYGNVQLASKESGINERLIYFHLTQAKKKGFEPIKTGEIAGNEQNQVKQRSISLQATPI